eukprot:scaffold1728_cov116-Isochrysis_galbana.AAC.6
MQVGLAQGGRHRVEHEDRPVLGRHARVHLTLGHEPRRDELLQLGPKGGVVRWPAQEVAEGLGEGGRVGSQHVLQGLRLFVLGEEDVGLPDHVAAIVDDTAPERARLIPAGVGGVDAEDEQQRQRRHGNREREDGQRDLLDEAHQRGRLKRRLVQIAAKVMVTGQAHVDEDT